MLLSNGELFAYIFCSLLIGLDKGGVPGLAALGMSFVLSMHGAASSNVGHNLALFVPVLAFADIWAIFAYRNAISWPLIRAFVFPLGFGISAGFLLLGKLSDDVIRRSSGVALLALSVFYNFSSAIRAVMSKRRDFNRSDDISDTLPLQVEVHACNTNSAANGSGKSPFASMLFLQSSSPYSAMATVGFGFASGLLTVIANVAGPVVAVYLMSMNLQKREVNGNRAFIFVLANSVKIPCQIMIGNLHTPDVWVVLPLALFAGSVALLTEAYLIPLINQRTFERAAWFLVTLSAIKLVLL